MLQSVSDEVGVWARSYIGYSRHGSQHVDVDFVAHGLAGSHHTSRSWWGYSVCFLCSEGFIVCIRSRLHGACYTSLIIFLGLASLCRVVLVDAVARMTTTVDRHTKRLYFS